MTEHPDYPDFIVDQFGNVQRIKQPKHSQKSEAVPSDPGPMEHYGASTKGKSLGKFIFIPIPVGLIMTLIFLLLSSTKEGRANTHLSKGADYLDSGNYVQAINEFDKAIKLLPELGEAYNNRALAYFALGNYDKAIADCDKAIQLSPKSASAYMNRGVVHSTIGNNDKAILDFNIAIQINDNFAEAYFNRGLARNALAYYEDAISDFNKAIELTPETIFGPEITPDPDNPYYRYKMTEKNSKPIQLEIDLPIIYVYRGLAYLGVPNLEHALSDFNKAIRLEPYLSKAYFYRGYTYLSQWNDEKAIDDFLMVLKLKNDPTTQQAAEAILIELGAK